MTIKRWALGVCGRLDIYYYFLNYVRFQSSCEYFTASKVNVISMYCFVLTGKGVQSSTTPADGVQSSTTTGKAGGKDSIVKSDSKQDQLAHKKLPFSGNSNIRTYTHMQGLPNRATLFSRICRKLLKITRGLALRRVQTHSDLDIWPFDLKWNVFCCRVLT